MVVVLQNTWVLYRINKDEGDESLHRLAFRRNEWNADHSRVMQELRVSHQMSVMSLHITRYHVNNKACVGCAKITQYASV